MGRRVITYNDLALAKAAHRLEALVASTGYEPDAVLSIRRGGEYIGNQIFLRAKHFSTKLQRPGTAHKHSAIFRIVRILPIKLRDRLRIMEAWWLSRKSKQPVDSKLVELPVDIKNCDRILIVDDAVDSGSTLQAVQQAVRTRCPHSDILTAVLTVTTRNPLILPDFSLFNNLTLIRFPWSMDN